MFVWYTTAMNLRSGLDIIHIPSFEKELKENKERFIESVFHPEEVEYAKIPRLASIFAAKEAVNKALGLLSGKWLDIKVLYAPDGKPYLAKFPKPKGTRTGGAWKHE